MNLFLKSALMFFCFSCSFVFAATEDQVDSFFEVSGYNKQIEQFPALIKKGMDMAYQRKKDIPEDLKIKMESLAAEHFKADLIKISVKKQILKKVSDEDMKTVLDFYGTDTAKYFTELEVRGSDPAIMEKIKTFDPESVDKTLRDEIDKIYYGLNMLEDTLETQKIVMIAMFQVVNATLPKENQKTLDEINEVFKKTIQSNKQLYEKLIKTNLYLVYESAPLEKLKIYTGYLNSSVVKNFYRQFMIGKQEAIKIAATNFGSSLVKEFKK